MGSKDAHNSIQSCCCEQMLPPAAAACKKGKCNSTPHLSDQLLQESASRQIISELHRPLKAAERRLLWSLATRGLRKEAVRSERGWAGVKGRPEARKQVTRMEAGGGQLFKKRIPQLPKGAGEHCEGERSQEGRGQRKRKQS